MSALSDLRAEYDPAIAAYRTACENDPGDPEAESDAYDAIRDRIFAYRPTSMSEVAEKAAIMLDIYDDGEGMNENRLKQFLQSLMPAATKR